MVMICMYINIHVHLYIYIRINTYICINSCIYMQEITDLSEVGCVGREGGREGGGRRIIIIIGLKSVAIFHCNGTKLP